MLWSLESAAMAEALDLMLETSEECALTLLSRQGCQVIVTAQ